MKVWNLFATLAAVGVVGLVADTAVAQVDVKPGGVTVTGPAGGSLTVPFTGQPPTVTQPGTAVQPGTSGTFTQPGTFAPGTPGYYPGYSTYPSPYYQQPYGYQQPYMGYQQPNMGGYSYYTPGQSVTPAGGYLPQQAVGGGYMPQQAMAGGYMPQQAMAGGGCCGAGAVMPVGYNAPMAGGCCGAGMAQPIATAGGSACCDPCASGGKQRRGLFRRY